MQALGVKAAWPAVKSEADYQKRKTFDSQAKAAPAKRARGDENAPARADSVLDELLERDTRPFGMLPAAPSLGGATSFRGMFPKAEAATAPVRGTFEDLAGQRHSKQVLGDLGGSNWLPDALPMAVDATNIASAAGGAGGDRQLPASTSAPLDWSLKTTVRFSSPQPFVIAEEAAFLPGREVLAAQRAFASCESGLHALSMEQRFLAALHSWQFPQDPWPAPTNGSAKLRGPPPEVLGRRRDWQAAMCSLYDALRGGACDAFYYLSPQGSQKPFVVLFGAAGVGGRQRVHAMLTKSSAGLRALLSGGMALGFATPLLPADADRRAEIDQSAVPLDGSQSLLMFEGGVRVHGLFDWLLNESFRAHGDECDVPTLMSPCQFAHAALSAVQPKSLGVTDGRDPGRAQHRLELKGTALPPWVLDRLSGILSVTQDGTFAMACDTHPLTLALNWHPGGGGKAAATTAAAGSGRERRNSRKQVLGMSEGAEGGGGGGCGMAVASQPVARKLSDYEARQRGCWDSEEAARWRSTVPGLSCNVVRELHCEGGQFVGKLSAKSAERVVL